MDTAHTIQIEDPPVAKALFGNTQFAWIWLIVRLYVGYEWLKEGIDKVTSPVWGGAHAGVALSGWLKGSFAKTQGAHPDVQGWYAAFLHGYVEPYPAFWSILVSYGELLVGIGLIIGLFTGIAAFFGCSMNASYLLGGTVSTNPILFGLSLLLILAWKTAGWYGLDRWVLPRLGTPWHPGPIDEPTPVSV
jgi:thiosulfate dehydrogenase [quinone] large subunit